MGRHTARPAGSSTQPWADCRHRGACPEAPGLSAPHALTRRRIGAGGGGLSNSAGQIDRGRLRRRRLSKIDSRGGHVDRCLGLQILSSWFVHRSRARLGLGLGGVGDRRGGDIGSAEEIVVIRLGRWIGVEARRPPVGGNGSAAYGGSSVGGELIGLLWGILLRQGLGRALGSGSVGCVGCSASASRTRRSALGHPPRRGLRAGCSGSGSAGSTCMLCVGTGNSWPALGRPPPARNLLATCSGFARRFHLAAPRRDGEPTAATVGVVRVSVITLFPQVVQIAARCERCRPGDRGALSRSRSSISERTVWAGIVRWTTPRSAVGRGW